MPVRNPSIYLAIVKQSDVRCAWKQARIERPNGSRIVKDLQPFHPCFFIFLGSYV